MFIWMPFHSLLTISFLKINLFGISGNPEDLIVILRYITWQEGDEKMKDICISGQPSSN